MPAIQYTIRSITPQLDRAIRKKARLTGMSINQVVNSDLARIYGVANSPTSAYDSIKDLVGKGMDDETYAILQEQEIHDKDPKLLKREQDKLEKLMEDLK
jgi:hypothetical protein